MTRRFRRKVEQTELVVILASSSCGRLKIESYKPYALRPRLLP